MGAGGRRVLTPASSTQSTGGGEAVQSPAAQREVTRALPCPEAAERGRPPRERLLVKTH